jgi:hypothetical protein
VTGPIDPRSRGDGRNVDAAKGILSGEAADQTAPGERAESKGGTEDVLSGSLASSYPSQDEPTYYDRPVVKEPVWIPAIPAYFYLGGVAGAAATLGLAADLAGGDHVDDLVTACRRVAAGSALAGTALLVTDLGRPERFLNMLRVFRKSSPMSVGSWILATFAPAAAAAAVTRGRSGSLGKAGDVAAAVSGSLGPGLAGYTGVLLANTVVPAWAEGGSELPPLFISSAVSAAASLLEPFSWNESEGRTIRFFGVAGKAADLVLAERYERSLGRVEGVAETLTTGVPGSLWRLAKAAMGASLVLSLLPGRGRVKNIATGLFGSVGGVATRFAIFRAGKASTKDPRLTFRSQRQALEGGAHAAARG